MRYVLPNPLVFAEPVQSIESIAAQARVVEAVERDRERKAFQLFLGDLEDEYRGWLLAGAP